jgi:hypothetical protein
VQTVSSQVIRQNWYRHYHKFQRKTTARFLSADAVDTAEQVATTSPASQCLSCFIEFNGHLNK